MICIMCNNEFTRKRKDQKRCPICYKKYRNEYNKQFIKNNKKYIAEYYKIYYRNNKEKYTEAKRIAYKKNPNKINAYRKKWLINNLDKAFMIYVKSLLMKQYNLKINQLPVDIINQKVLQLKIKRQIKTIKKQLQ